MNIISEKEKIDRMMDGINTIFSLSEAEFDLFMHRMQHNHSNGLEQISFYYLTDECENPAGVVKLGLEQEYNSNNQFIGRGYFGGQKFSTNEILQKCSQMMSEYDSESLEYARIKSLLHSRDLESFKDFSSTDSHKALLVKKVFDLLSDDSLLSAFLDYDNHPEDFSVEGKTIDISEYLKIMGSIFGNVDKNGKLRKMRIDTDFLIPNVEQMKGNYMKVFTAINMDRYVNPAFTFEITQALTDKVIRIGEEPDWNMNPEIRDAILKDMPIDLSDEEKALYVYCKMCSMFSYDQGYLYRDKLKKVNYESDFSKEHLESLQLDSKITCYDFARMFVKLTNELSDNINPVMILNGMNEGHALVGFYTQNASVTLEAVNVSSNSDVTNDLMKAKNGVELNGIKIVSDRNGLVELALQKVYQMVFGTPSKTIKEFIQELKSIPQEESIPNDISMKIESLINVMKARHVSGNEFTQTFWGMRKSHYFGNELPEMAYLGELVHNEKGVKSYKRHILLRTSSNSNENGHDCFMIDTELLGFYSCRSSEIREKLMNGQLVYEDEKHKLTGIDKEESI